MSVEEKLLADIARSAARVRLEFILIGNAAASVLGAPIVTEDIDLFVRHTPRNLQKIRAVAERLGGVVGEPFAPASRMQRVMTPEVNVDFIFELSSRKKFESVRSRARRVKFGGCEVLVASLADIIAAKEAAGRPKDKATLHVLKNTLRTQQEMEETTR
jgi:predicted nucleotidyltransferase